ncbi:MAG TPA: tagaturonate epimerase family protein [Verrucomicrobiae bacterium]|nr:tagaturonate epimerase family protein [Verrucomicrobiae bacterium]
MNRFLPLGKFSFGMGDRFGRQGAAQLRACILASELGAEIVPVWNKSNREHTLIGTESASVRAEADAAVKLLGWQKSYHVDADHIRLETVDGFVTPSDFFTIDVADSIGKPANAADVSAFVNRHPELIGKIVIPNASDDFITTRAEVERIANKFLLAIQEAGKIYRHIAKAKGETHFITEVSMDETDSPQTPPELLIILAALADEKIPLQTIAPKFTGRFNKGVDYVGDLKQFEKEFSDDLAVIDFAVRTYHLPLSLKLSVHSGSDKFSIYAAIRRSLNKFDAGLHIKTAGTTWLEELIGLAEAGGDGLEIAREIYACAIEHVDEFCAPYAAVIDIDKSKLPDAATVNAWTSRQFISALRHDQKNPAYNRSFRQLLHVSFKVAAKKGERYLNALRKHEAIIARNVTENLFERHMKPLLLGETEKIVPRKKTQLEAVPA